MATSSYKIFIDNDPAPREQAETVTEVRVDRAAGMISEAELDVAIRTDRQGDWSGIDESFMQPFVRIRVEARIDDGNYQPLIDGPIVHQKFQLNAAPGQSRATLVVQDDSVLLNHTEGVELFEDKTADQIARQLFEDQGLTPEVDSVPESQSGLTRFVVRRGTAMNLLRDLARRHGLLTYVKPGPGPGESVGVFKYPDLTPAGYPQLLLMGRERNIEDMEVELDGLRPLSASAGSVRVTDRSAVDAAAEAPDIDAMSERAAHGLTEPGSVMLTRTRETEADLDAAATAAVNHSSWAYSARTEVNACNYTAVLEPYRVIAVAGAGALSGEYLISRVSHVLTAGEYRQQLTLRRNARMSAQSGALPSAAEGMV